MVFGGLGVLAVGSLIGYIVSDASSDENVTYNYSYETPPETATDKIVKVGKAVLLPVGVYFAYKAVKSRKKGG